MIKEDFGVPFENSFADQEALFSPEEDDSPIGLTPPDRRLVTQPYDFAVRTIIDQINDHSLEVKPSFQRGYVWDDKRASGLVESLLMNIPIPVCYFAEEESGKFTVIDGHQRLYSIWRYASNLFALKDLRTLNEFNGKYFRDLREREQRLILGRSIRCIVITQESHPEIRFEVFERLNSGSMQATDQEIRNAIFRGDFNNLIKSLAKSSRWLRVLGKRELDKRMRDEELILRFFAVNNNYLLYQPPLRAFLNQYVEQKTFLIVNGRRQSRISLSEEEKKDLTSLFNETMDKVLAVFNNHAFRVYSDGKWEKPVNRALFDVVTLVFSQIPEHKLIAKANEIDSMLKDLFSDPDFMQAISGSRAHRASFVTRIKKFSQGMATIGLDTGIHQTFPDQV